MSHEPDWPDGPRPRPLRERNPADLTEEQRQLLEEEESADRATIGCAILFLLAAIAAIWESLT